jgi:predicted nucleic acid-binding protein
MTEPVVEAEHFPEDCYRLTPVTGNHVPDTHVATVLQEHRVRRIHTTDTDVSKFDFLEVINLLRKKR